MKELNHKIHDEEVAAGLWDKKKTGKAKESKSKAKYEVKKDSEVAGEPEIGF